MLGGWHSAGRMAQCWEEGTVLGGWHSAGRRAQCWEDGTLLGGWHSAGRMAQCWEDGTVLGGWHSAGRRAQCWEDGTVSQDMRDAIITLVKNKGDRGDCNNYRGISLLSIVGNTFARVILNRLQKLAERVYPQWCFRASVPRVVLQSECTPSGASKRVYPQWCFRRARSTIASYRKIAANSKCPSTLSTSI